MDAATQSFLQDSPLARRIKLPARIIAQRTSLSPGELMQIKEQGEYGPVPSGEQICELKVGGVVIARGKIVKKRADYYFKIQEKYAQERPE